MMRRAALGSYSVFASGGGKVVVPSFPDVTGYEVLQAWYFAKVDDVEFDCIVASFPSGLGDVPYVVENSYLRSGAFVLTSQSYWNGTIWIPTTSGNLSARNIQLLHQLRTNSHDHRYKLLQPGSQWKGRVPAYANQPSSWWTTLLLSYANQHETDSEYVVIRAMDKTDDFHNTSVGSLPTVESQLFTVIDSVKENGAYDANERVHLRYGLATPNSSSWSGEDLAYYLNSTVVLVDYVAES